MGEIVAAGFVSHSPTIMLPKEVRYELNEGEEISLVPGLQNIRSIYLDALRADTIIVFDTHWFTTVEFVIASHRARKGHYTSEELPRGISAIPYEFEGDPELATDWARRTREEENIPCVPCDDPYLPIHYPTLNLHHYLKGPEKWLNIGTCQTGGDAHYLGVGSALARAVEASDRRVVLLASGGMSHRFWPLDMLPKHEASDPIHLVSPEARAADEDRLRWWQDGDHVQVIAKMDEYRQHAPEGRFGHYLMMIGALGGAACRAPGRLMSNYENSAGTGQVHVWFERPTRGWTASA